jgi:hypothetical protein
MDGQVQICVPDATWRGSCSSSCLLMLPSGHALWLDCVALVSPIPQEHGPDRSPFAPHDGPHAIGTTWGGAAAAGACTPSGGPIQKQAPRNQPRQLFNLKRPLTASRMLRALWPGGCWGSFDHLVGADGQRQRDRDTECLRCLEIDDQLDFAYLLNREIGGLSPRLASVQG